MSDIELKLYIWDEFEPDWDKGLAFAIAETEKIAMHMVNNKSRHKVDEFGPVSVYPINQKISRSCVGGS